MNCLVVRAMRVVREIFLIEDQFRYSKLLCAMQVCVSLDKETCLDVPSLFGRRHMGNARCVVVHVCAKDIPKAAERP
jgi:hypothetical protein